jgi:hypothetical protein
MSKALTPAQIAELTKLPEKKRSGIPKAVLIDYSDRSLPMWWKLPTERGECTVVNHDEQESMRERIVVEIENVKVCRYCYLAGRDERGS